MPRKTVSDEQRDLIREKYLQGYNVKSIADEVGLSVKTVGKYIKNAPAPTPQEADVNTGDFSITPEYTTKDPEMSSGKQDELKGRHFAFVVYPSEKWIRENVPDCTYDGSSGWGEAPDDWIEQLQNTGLPFVISPLHDKDINPDGTMKKPHWHVIVSWSNTTTYRNARVLAQTILHSPLPQLLKAVEGMYRYLTHADNPEKYQYTDELPHSYNGWERPLDSAAVTAILADIRKRVYLDNCLEYGEIVSVCAQLGNDYFDVVSSHTYFFDKLCSSFRHSPLRTLERVMTEFDGNEAEVIQRLYNLYSGGNENESNDE